MNSTSERTLRVLADRQAILDCIFTYCRAVDRLDRDLLTSVYHADAIDDHGFITGSPADFADWAFTYHRKAQHATQHIVTNHTCELDGDTAHTETYWLFAAMNIAGPPLSLSGGRYVDRFERRDGRWAIAARKCLFDWGGAPGEQPVGPEVLALFLGAGRPSRDRADPSYERPLRVDRTRVGVHFPPQ
jgi:hypothetical protein